MTVFLVLAALAAGICIGEHNARKKPRDHRQPFRYWRN